MKYSKHIELLLASASLCACANTVEQTKGKNGKEENKICFCHIDEKDIFVDSDAIASDNATEVILAFIENEVNNVPVNTPWEVIPELQNRSRNNILLALARYFSFDSVEEMFEFIKFNPDNCNYELSEPEDFVDIASLESIDYICGWIQANSGNVDVQDDYGSTPLHWAVMNQQWSFAGELVDAGADLNIQNYGGETPLFLLGSKDPCLLYENVFHALVSVGARLDFLMGNGDTILAPVLRQDNVEIMQYLLEQGLSFVNIDDKQRGITLVHRAAKYNSVNVLSALLTEDPSLIDTVSDDLQTPLHYAVMGNALNTMKLLMENGAVLDQHDLYNSTPFMYAVLACETDTLNFAPIFSLFLQYGGVKQFLEPEVIWAASMYRVPEIFFYVLRNEVKGNITPTLEAIVNIPDIKGGTVLEREIRGDCNPGRVEWLLTLGATVDDNILDAFFFQAYSKPFYDQDFTRLLNIIQLLGFEVDDNRFALSFPKIRIFCNALGGYTPELRDYVFYLLGREDC